MVMNAWKYGMGLLGFLMPLCGLFGQGTSLFFNTYGSSNGGEVVEAVIQAADGGLVMVGTSDSYSPGGDEDLLMLKTDVNGNVLWAKTYGGSDDDMGLDVKETPDGGLIVVGWTKSFGASRYDCWILKTDAGGNVQWQKRIGGNRDDQAWSVAVDGNAYVVAAGTASFGAGKTDLWLMKLDAAGNILWQKTYGTAGDDAPPGDYDEYVARALVDADGHYLISSTTDGAGHGGDDIYLAKLNPSDGSIIWQYAYGDSEDESSWAFAVDPAGGYYLPGNFTDPATYEADLWVVHVDTAGAIQWQKTFGIASKWDEALNVAALADGSALLAAYFEENSNDWRSSALMVDHNGQLKWARQYRFGNLDWMNAAYPMADGALAMVGVTTNTQTWDEDITLFKTDTAGDIPNCNAISAFSPVMTATATTRQAISLTVNTPTASFHNTNATVANVTPGKVNRCAGVMASVGPSPLAATVQVYPNPTGGRVTIQWTAPHPRVMMICRNALGQEVARTFRRHATSADFSIPGPPGLYFLELYYDDGTAAVLPLVKQ